MSLETSYQKARHYSIHAQSRGWEWSDMQLAECSNLGSWTYSVVSKPMILSGGEYEIEESYGAGQLWKNYE